MKTGTRVGRTALGILALSLAGAAQASIFDFAGNDGLNTAPNPNTYTLTVDGLTVNVSAFNGIFSNVDTSNPVNVRWNSGNGLGTAGYGSNQINTCADCQGNPGEGLLLDFGQVVTLTQAQFGAWQVGAGDDADFAFGTPASGALQDVTGVTVASNIATWNTSLTGSQFFFAARQDATDTQDMFWLRSVTAAAAVPEPSTWAMMLMGFGAAGYSMRRRRQSTRALAQPA